VIAFRNMGLAACLVLSAGATIMTCGDDDADSGDGTSSNRDSGPGGGGNRDSGTSTGGGRMDASTSGNHDGGTSNNGGTSGGNGGTGGDDEPNMSSDEDAGADEPCGAVVCEAPECCVDPFASLCGAKLGRACLMPPPETAGSDPRCPSVSIMGIFSIPSCCTDDGQCGIDAAMFGGGCVSYEEAEMGAQMMGAPPGAIPWPEPQSCD
jgi:hypothetical protein